MSNRAMGWRMKQILFSLRWILNSPGRIKRLVKLLTSVKDVRRPYHIDPAPVRTPEQVEHDRVEAARIAAAEVPGNRKLMAGDTWEKRVTFLKADLASKYPRLDRREVKVQGFPRNDDILAEQIYQAFENKQDAAVMLEQAKQATMFYSVGFDTIIIRDPGIRLLGSSSPQEWGVGLHTFVHEWYHALRAHPEVLIPFEEGLAELFARQVSPRLLNVQDSAYFLQDTDYQVYVAGVELIARHFSAGQPLLPWLLSLRNIDQPQSQWIASELAVRGVTQHRIDAVLNSAQSGHDWLAAVKEALEGGEL